VIVRLAVAALITGHSLIHLGFVSPRPPPAPGAPPWPFELERSWLLSAIGLDGAARSLGWILVATLLAGYAVAALAAIPLLPATWFAPAAVVGSVASLVLLVVFFHPWLVIGVALDIVLLWAVLIGHWTPVGSPA
jgi:hypothetical protein